MASNATHAELIESQPKSFQCDTVTGGHVHLGDKYFVVNGESVQVAGLALALFPVIVGIVDGYCSSIKSRDTKNLADELKNHEATFQSSLQSLLGSVASEEEIRALTNGWEDPMWRESALNDKVVQHLGDDASGILKSAQKIYRTLCQLGKKLQPNVLGAKTDESYLERAKKVLKSFYYGKEDKPSLDRLKNSIGDFQRLTSDAVKLSSSKGRSFKELKDLDLVREWADGLYDALRGGWKCKCECLHPANIELDIWSTRPSDENEDTLLEFSFLFADDAENARKHHWMTAEVVQWEKTCSEGSPAPMDMQSPSASSTAFQSETTSSPDREGGEGYSEENHIDDMCSVLKDSEFESRPPRRRVGSICDSNHRHNFWLSTRSDKLALATMKHSVRLAEALGQSCLSEIPAYNYSPSWLELHTRHRVQLGLMLAWGVLQISSTGWLEGYWTRDNIMLVVDSNDKPRPYVIHRFESLRKNSDTSSLPTLSPSTSNDIAKWSGNDALFALAIFLIEMCYGRRIEDLAKSEEKTDGKANPWTTFLTATRLSREVNNQLGLRYAQAVRACLTQSNVKFDVAGRPVDSKEFAKFMLKDVIRPLEDAASYFGDVNSAS